MKPADLTFLLLTCFLALTFKSALCDNTPATNSTSYHFQASDTNKLNCSGLDNCVDPNCIYTKKSNTSTDEKFVAGQEMTIGCGNKLTVKFKYNENVTLGNEKFVCYDYGNENKTFTVMELSLTKIISSDNSSLITCINDNDKKNCSLANETDQEIRYVIGFPDVCSVYTESPPTTPPTAPPTAPPTTSPTASPTSDPASANGTSAPQTDTTTKPGPSGADQVKLVAAAALAALLAMFISLFNINM